jgi:hypothetical protein
MTGANYGKVVMLAMVINKARRLPRSDGFQPSLLSPKTKKSPQNAPKPQKPPNGTAAEGQKAKNKKRP